MANVLWHCWVYKDYCLEVRLEDEEDKIKLGAASAAR